MGNFPKFLISFSEVTQFSSILSSSYLLIDLHKSLLQEEKKELQLQRCLLGLRWLDDDEEEERNLVSVLAAKLNYNLQSFSSILGKAFVTLLSSTLVLFTQKQIRKLSKVFFLSFFWQWHKSFGTLLLNIKVPLSIVGLVHLSYYGGTKNYEGVLGLSLLGFCSARTITIFQS